MTGRYFFEKESNNASERSGQDSVMLIILIAVLYVRVAKGDEDAKKEDSIAHSGNDIFVYKD